MMSEEGGFIDVESDEVPELGGEATASSSGQNSNDADTLVSGRPIVSLHLLPFTNHSCLCKRSSKLCINYSINTLTPPHMDLWKRLRHS